MSESTPHAEYSQRRAAHAAQLEVFERRERWLSNLRLVVFLAALAAGWFAFGSHRIAPPWVAPPVIAFIALLIVHDRVIQRRTRAQRCVSFYDEGLARLEERWLGTGETGEQYRDPHHPYAEDFDLFNKGGLFELLCTARTPAGRNTLAAWLSGPAELPVVSARQAAVLELTPRLDLRQELSLLGDEVSSRLDPSALVRWGAAPAAASGSALLPVVAGLLSTLSIAALLAWLLLGVGPIPFLLALVPQLVFAAIHQRRIKPILMGLEAPTRDLTILRDLLARIEVEVVESPRLAELKAALDTEGEPPSRRIAQLQRLADLMDSRRNQFFAPFAALGLCGTQLGLAVERWREHCGAALESWIDAAGEIETLAALSGHAYENPDHVMPVLSDSGPRIEGKALGHPLLPRDQCVRNDLCLDSERQALIISGSNMSGKSTFLRTVGCNVLLALAGAPVRAESLTLSPLQIAGAIQVRDSLLEGTSLFYAEIKRLRQVVELCDGEVPVLFLLDEILHGTNSHDRRIGASAVVKGLVERGALGLVTTHDLALAKIADELAPRIENRHFEDHLEDGLMAFDYRLRPGIVEKSNALELMRAVGLEV